MGKIERFFYNLLKKHPKIKNFFRNLYQFLNVIIFRPKKIDIKNEYILKENSFFGFHDKSPFSYDNSLLLTHKLDKDIKWGLPKKNTDISVGYYYGESYSSYKEIDKTNAWNYQQGSMLQWVNKTEVIYNLYDSVKNKHVSKIYNISEEKYRFINRPVGAVSPCGNYAISYSFERLRVGMEGYGYANGVDPDDNNDIPLEGLFLINLNSNTSEEIITIKELISPECLVEGFHFFTHVQFSPNSESIIFFHRIKQKQKRLITKMYAMNLQSKQIYKFPTFDMVSHVFWKNNDQVIGFANTEEGDGFYLFDIKKNKYERINVNNLNVDGHPYVSKNGKLMLVDTYPNKKRLQKLFLYNFETSNSIKLASFYSPFKFKEIMRCDLHPRFSHDDNLVSIDTSFSGVRSTMILRLNEEV